MFVEVFITSLPLIRQIKAVIQMVTDNQDELVAALKVHTSRSDIGVEIVLVLLVCFLAT